MLSPFAFGRATHDDPGEARRLRLSQLDDCLQELEEANERDEPVLSQELARHLRQVLPGISPGMLVTESLEIVFQAQRACLAGTPEAVPNEAATVFDLELATVVPTLIADLAEAMDEEAARRLTENIKDSMHQVCTLLLDAHRGRAWVALGYRSWEQYVQREFGMSRSRSYELLDQSRVLRTLQAAAAVSAIPDISTYAARQIKPHLEEVLRVIRRRTYGVPEQRALEVVHEVVDEVRRRSARGRAGDMAMRGNPGSSPAAADLDRLFESIDRLSNMPPPAAIAEMIPERERHRLPRLERAARWLTSFAETWAAHA